MPTAAVVLAAGRGTRFRSQLPKVLHAAAGRTLLRHVLEALRPLELDQVVVVVGHGRDLVEAAVAAASLPGATTAVQDEQLGTGHAVQCALPALRDDVDSVIVIQGDCPLLTPDTLQPLHGHDDALLTAVEPDPTGYGRVVRADDGTVQRVVEERDATPEQRAITEVNAGVYRFSRDRLEAALARIDTDNAQGERYLTDVVSILVGDGVRVVAEQVRADEVAGVNDRAQLADAAAVLRGRHLRTLLRAGVSVVDPAACWVDVDVEVGVDTVLHPGTILAAGTVVGERCEIGPDTRLRACVVGDDANVLRTEAAEAEIGDHADVGPFTHLRPGTVLAARTKAGAFVQVKNSHVGEGSKVPHLAYVGDAEIGRDANLACGVITVNYDGRDKHRTVVEDGAFVGCDVALVAPVTVGRGAYVAAGSPVTDDVPPGALAIARSRQTVKEGWATRDDSPGRAPE